MHGGDVHPQPTAQNSVTRVRRLMPFSDLTISTFSFSNSVGDLFYQSSVQKPDLNAYKLVYSLPVVADFTKQHNIV